MFFRQSGIRHTSYTSDNKLFPIPVDRIVLLVLLAVGVAAPYLINSLYLNSYILPWMIWTAAALGLNLVTGWAGQLHLGYAAVMAVGTYSAIHAARFGVPWEFALLIGGLFSAAIGSLFAVAALREALVRNLDELSALSPEELVDQRYARFRAFGEFTEGLATTNERAGSAA